MATGLSKTKWNGHENLEEMNGHGRSHAITLSYPDKQEKATVLATAAGVYAPVPIVPVNETILSSGDLFYDDNLPVLAHLYRDPAVRGHVQLIYIDPPYATGTVFKSRTQKNAYTDVRTGDQYLEFMRQRLIFLRELLSDDGSIYVHLDQTMAFHVKIMMDEIFGAQNFRNWITRKKSNPKNYTRKTYGNVSDYILFYTKSNDYVWNRAYDAWTEKGAKREYPCIEQGTGRRYKKVPIHAPGTRNGATGKMWHGMMPPEGKHWQYTPTRLDAMDARGEIYWSPTGNPRRKIYLDASQGKPVQDIWLDDKDAHNQNIKITGYPTEKNPAVLKRIIQASSNPGDVILDCFAGSGTTLDVAHQLGRRWIGVDSSQLAIETILKRFMYGTHAMGDFVQPNKLVRSAAVASPLNFTIHTHAEMNSTVREIITHLQETPEPIRFAQPDAPIEKQTNQLDLGL